MSTLAVVGGAGMGSQIAQQAALHGVEVILQDVSGDQLGKAVEQNRELLQRRVDEGASVRRTPTRRLPRYTPRPSWGRRAG